MSVVTLRQLLDSGVHLGPQTGRRWNRKMKPFILTERDGIYIIDLEQTLPYINRAYEFVRDIVARGGTVLFVGTKEHAQETIADQAMRVGQPYVSQRWLGGMLTNFQTVAKRIGRMKELEEIDFDDVAGSTYDESELLLLKRELVKLKTYLGGIRNLTKPPSVLWVVDPKKEHLAVDEARKLNIPVVAVLDTNCDPDEVDFPIPGNDDAVDSIGLLTRVIADAVVEGLIARRPAEQEEPLAEWERELLGDYPRLASALTASRDIPTQPDIQSRPRNRLLLGTTNIDYDLLLGFLSEKVGMKFRNHSKSDEWVIGARVLVNDDDNTVLIRAVRSYASVQIELVWTGFPPPIPLMQRYAREIPIMLYDLEYENHRANGGTLASFEDEQIRAAHWRMA